MIFPEDWISRVGKIPAEPESKTSAKPWIEIFPEPEFFLRLDLPLQQLEILHVVIQANLHEWNQIIP